MDTAGINGDRVEDGRRNARNCAFCLLILMFVFVCVCKESRFYGMFVIGLAARDIIVVVLNDFTKKRFIALKRA